MTRPALVELDLCLQALVESELEPGERVVWVRQPIARWFTPGDVGAVGFGALWTMVLCIPASNANDAGDFQGPARLATGLAFVVFFAIGALLITAPFWSRQALLRTVYVITDRRAIVLRRKAFDGRAVLSFPPDRLMSMERVEGRDGSGDLIFEVVTTGTGSSTRTERRGFRHVADVGDVEAILRKTLLRDRVRDVL